MNRPVAVGSASGVASSLILSILGNLARETPFEPVVHCLDTPSGINWEEIPWAIFLAGVLTGVLLGPLVDLVWLLRQKWRRALWGAICAEVRPKATYRVLG